MATLFPRQSLNPGQSLKSNNQLHTLTMQTDGNVVLYNQHGQALWATNTYGITPRDFAMQTDGNLVLYDTSGAPKWASNTYNNPGAFLNVQDDGNLVVYKAGSQTETANNALWAAASNDMPTQGGGQGTPPASSGGGMAQELLNAHNSYRSQVGVPPLAWSDNLASQAQKWANSLASNGSFQHSGVAGEGENLWKGTSGAFSFTQMVGGWGDEKQSYNGGVITSSNYSHYTQMVWKNTTQVGCAGANGVDGQYVLVCRYSPQGNIIGQAPY